MAAKKSIAARRDRQVRGEVLTRFLLQRVDGSFAVERPAGEQNLANLLATCSVILRDSSLDDRHARVIVEDGLVDVRAPPPKAGRAAGDITFVWLASIIGWQAGAAVVPLWEEMSVSARVQPQPQSGELQEPN